MSNDEMWQDAEPALSVVAGEAIQPVVPEVNLPAPPDAEMTFRDLASRLNDNLASATLRLVDAAQDFTGLIQAYVAAGQELERSLAAVKEFASSSQQALDDARQAAAAAAVSAQEAHQAQQKSVDLIQRSTSEHLALAELTDNLRQRISALSVLGEPLPRHELPIDISEAAGKTWEAA